MKWPFVLRKKAAQEADRYYLLGRDQGRREIIESDVFKRFDYTEKFIDSLTNRAPISKNWEVNAKYVALLNENKKTVYIGALHQRTYIPGDFLNIHFVAKGTQDASL